MRIVLTRREALDVPDGINIFLFSLADALQDLGHEVILVSTAASSAKQIEEFFSPRYRPRVQSLGSHRTISYKRALAAWAARGKAVVASLKPDLVIVNGAVPLRFDALTCTVSHDSERRLGSFPGVRTAFKRWAYRKTDIIVATCREVRDALARDLGLPPARIAIVPTCIRIENYKRRPVEEREDAILHMGTVPYKNPLATLRAFQSVGNGRCRLYLTGKVTDEIRKFIGALPADRRSRIELLGYAPAGRLLDLLGTVKVVSVPSVYDSAVASPTVLEALASATPVAASTSISADLLQSGREGYVCDPSDNGAVAGAFDRLLSDTAQWRRMSARAIQTAERFSAPAVARMYLQLAAARAGAVDEPLRMEAGR